MQLAIVLSPRNRTIGAWYSLCRMGEDDEYDICYISERNLMSRTLCLRSVKQT